MSDHQVDVVDDTAHHRFLLTEDGVDAQLVYRATDDRLILVHTEVPESIGGRGLGGHLVRAAIGRARRTGETIVPQCPYARRWIEGHPDAVAGVTIG